MSEATGDSAKLAKIASPAIQGDPLERVEAFDELAEPLTIELLRSLLLWEAGAKHAVTAMKRLAETVVDVNELRICLVDEIEAALGRSPMAGERAHRIKLILTDIYNREHSVSLASLQTEGKREAKAYLDSLDAMPAFVASRVLLVGLGGHAFPLDDRLLSRLQAAGAAEDGADITAASGWAEREFRAGEALGAYFAIEAWSVTAKTKPATKATPKPAAKNTKKKTAKKAASKKTRTTKAGSKKAGSKKTKKTSGASKKSR